MIVSAEDATSEEYRRNVIKTKQRRNRTRPIIHIIPPLRILLRIFIRRNNNNFIRLYNCVTIEVLTYIRCSSVTAVKGCLVL